MKDTYNPPEYWETRLRKFGLDLNGVGNKVLSIEENEAAYREGSKVFINLCADEGIDFQSARILEVGVGNGYYARILRDLGVRDYLGIDITDVLFPQLKKMLPDLAFQKLDITKEGLPGKFDLIIMIDVTQHIVDDSLFGKALWNIRANLNVGGIFVVTSLLEDRGRVSPHERYRGMESFKKEFGNSEMGVPRAFRDKYIFSIKKDDPFPLPKRWAIGTGGRQFVIYSREGDELEKAFSLGEFYELELLDLIRSHKKGGIYFDVGANFGNHSLWFSAICKAEKVIAIEPSPLLAGLTGDVVRENGLDNVQIIEVAAAAKEGTAYLSSFYPKNAGKTQVVFNGTPGEEILCQTLDSIWEKHGESMPVTVLKVDVEGMEVEVLQGATKIIELFHPYIYAEWWTEGARDKIAQFLAPFGYELGPSFGRNSEWAWTGDSK